MPHYLVFWWFLVGHAVCDYPLQGDFLARAKSHKAPIPGISWMVCLSAHALIHAGAVTLITNRIEIGIAEFISHVLIDYGKSDGLWGFDFDQLLHILCKALWLCWLIYLP